MEARAKKVLIEQCETTQIRPAQYLEMATISAKELNVCSIGADTVSEASVSGEHAVVSEGAIGGGSISAGSHIHEIFNPTPSNSIPTNTPPEFPILEFDTTKSSIMYTIDSF